MLGLIAGVLFLRRRSGTRLRLFDVTFLGVCGLAVVFGMLLNTHFLLSPDGLAEVSRPDDERVLGALFGGLLGGVTLWALGRAAR